MREAFFSRADVGGTGAQDSVVAEVSPHLTNDVRMDLLLNTLESAGRDYIINQEGLNEMTNFGFQSLLHRPQAGGQVFHLMGRMTGLLSAGEELA